MRAPVTLCCLLLLASPVLATPDPGVPHYEKDDHSILVMAKDTYEQAHHDGRTVGEPVCFDWTNTDVAWHTLPDPEPWLIEDKDGTRVYYPASLDVEQEVPPGYSHSRCWFQTGAEGHIVPPGTYALVFTYDYTDMRLDFRIAGSPATE